MICRAAIALAALFPLSANAMDVGRSDYVFSSDLALQGFEPFAATTGNAVYGMKKGADMYLCFIADNGDFANERQAKLLAEIKGEALARDVPNIPVVCVLTQ